MYSKIAISACRRVSHECPLYSLGLDGFEERLDGGVIIAISFTTHRRFEVMLVQDFLVIVRAVLAATIGVMDAAFGWCLEGYGHLQCTDRKVAFHPIADPCPAGFAQHAREGPIR